MQDALLRRILAYHANTDFGRAHRFSDIKSLEDYRRHLPITTYEYVKTPTSRKVTKETRRPCSRTRRSTCSP